MSRNLNCLATVISVKPLGENNASVCFLTQTEGIIYATLYGGRKSKLRSLVSPWNTGILYLSLSSQNQNMKISDFDVKNYHLTFRENLSKGWAANLAAEIAIKTKCAGSNEHCWALLNGFFDGLELCTNQEQVSAGLIRFLWRYLDLLGIQPVSHMCSKCDQTFLSSKFDYNNVEYLHKGAFYSPTDNGFICTGCQTETIPFFLGAEAIRYLSALSVLTPQEARLIPLTKESAGQIKELVFYLIENACGSRLKSLETGMGIL